MVQVTVSSQGSGHNEQPWLRSLWEVMVLVTVNRHGLGLSD